MLYIESMDEIVEILKDGAFNEDCGHASYVATADKITELLDRVIKTTDAHPDFIVFDNTDPCRYYSLSLDNISGDLYFSIASAYDEDDEEFYSDFGLCLVDEEVSKNFENDYKKYNYFSRDYLSPVRVHWGLKTKDNDVDNDCEKCTFNCDAPCCTKNNATEEKVKVDTNDDGKVLGFTKSYKEGNSFFSYSFHSSDEDDVLNTMRQLNIKY